MRWQVGIGLAIVVGLALAVWAPSIIVQRQMAAALRAHADPSGSVRVRVRATAWGLVQRRVERVHVEATAIRLGDLVADRLTADLTGVQFVRSRGGWAPARVRSGDAVAEIGRGQLERFLRERGVDHPEVLVEPSGVTVNAAMPAGAVRVPVRLRGQFEASGRDLRFRVASLEVSGAELPQVLAGSLMGLVQPVISLRGLPIPLVIDRVSTETGRVIVRARVEDGAP